MTRDYTNWSDTGSTNQLYAFFYKAMKQERKFQSWDIYNPVKEFARMGLGTRTNEWRITKINKDYSVCFFDGEEYRN